MPEKIEDLEKDYNYWLQAISRHEKDGQYHTASYCRDRLNSVEIKIQRLKNGETCQPLNGANNLI